MKVALTTRAERCGAGPQPTERGTPGRSALPFQGASGLCSADGLLLARCDRDGRGPKTERAFTMIEVMIAIAIFFMVSFAILAVVSSGLRTAQALRVTRPNAGMLAAELSITNKLETAVESGDFGNLYRDYTWRSDTYEAGTNGLWQVDFTIYKRGNRSQPDSQMSILLYSPQSRTGRLGVQPP